MEDVILQMSHISKRFGSIQALDNVDFSLCRGEVHALLGENGSGKSTLIKILCGIIHADQGEIRIKDELKSITDVSCARNNGISIVHQELSFAPMMTVAENVFMGKEICRHGFIDRKKMQKETKKFLVEFGSDIEPDQLMTELSISQQQVVEIVKCISNNAQIIALDEPSASLSLAEVENLYKAVDRMREMGIAIIYVSHRMEELFRLSDKVTVLRDGKRIGTKITAGTTEDELVTMMAGRELKEHKNNHTPTDELALELKKISRNERVCDIDMKFFKKEVVGISGIVGAGRSELVRIIAGVDSGYSGEIVLNGQSIKIKSTEDAVRKGIVLIPENRAKEGLILMQSVRFNLSINVLEKFIKFISVNRKKERTIVQKQIDGLRIKTGGIEQKAGELSGGNQQKIVLGKWLATKPEIMILDEPTRGIDVGAKSEIYTLIDELAEQGMTIIVVSSDLPEIVRVSDRVYVLRQGEKVAELKKEQINQETIVKYATGVD